MRLYGTSTGDGVIRISPVQKVAVKTQADCGISGLPDKKEIY